MNTTLNTVGPEDPQLRRTFTAHWWKRPNDQVIFDAISSIDAARSWRRHVVTRYGLRSCENRCFVLRSEDVEGRPRSSWYVITARDVLLVSIQNRLPSAQGKWLESHYPTSPLVEGGGRDEVQALVDLERQLRETVEILQALSHRVDVLSARLDHLSGELERERSEVT